MFQLRTLVVGCGHCGRRNRIRSDRLVLFKALCGQCHTSLEDEAERLTLERGFGRAFRELERLRARINQVDGFWIFRFHRYSVEQLLRSKHAQQICSITEKIGSDIEYWAAEGKLGKLTRVTYLAKREAVTLRLEELRDEVVMRKSTKWEVARSVLRQLLRVVLGNLPDIGPKELPAAH